MPKINFQFHAMKEETVQYLMQTIEKYDLIVILIKSYSKLEYKIYDSKGISPDTIMKCDEIFLMTKEPIEGATTYIQFLRDNIGFLSILLGKEENSTLRESKISCEADGQTLKLWRKVITEYKKDMIKGAWVVSKIDGTTRYYKNHWYTHSAKKLFNQGWLIYPIAGNCLYKRENHDTI